MKKFVLVLSTAIGIIFCSTDSDKAFEFSETGKRIFHKSGGPWCQCLFDKIDIPPGNGEGILIWKEAENLNIAVASHASGGCTGYEQTSTQSSDTLTLIYHATGCAMDTLSTDIYYWEYKVTGFKSILLRTKKDSLVTLSEIKSEAVSKDECGI